MSQPVLSAADETVPPGVSRIGAIVGVLLFALLLVLPTPEGLSSAGQRMAAITALMGVFWVTQVLPMEVTSLLPLMLFPLLGVQSAKEVGAAYFSDSSFLYLGGFVLALGVERWGLHQRLALHIVSATGTGVRRIVLGFMLATFAISMWISNTASTLLMLPIALALLVSLEELGTETSAEERAQRRQRLSHFGMAVMLGIGYAATLGGMATLVGTPTNVVYVEILQKQFPAAPPISAAEWMIVWAPCALAFVLLTWAVITWGLHSPPELRHWDRNFFRDRLRGLGPMEPGERWMLVVFSITALLWMTRTGVDFGGGYQLPGWNQLASAWLASLGVDGG